MSTNSSYAYHLNEEELPPTVPYTTQSQLVPESEIENEAASIIEDLRQELLIQELQKRDLEKKLQTRARASDRLSEASSPIYKAINLDA
ncbi:hypothetical protein MBANPS3_012516 [Mucor bainieri]